MRREMIEHLGPEIRPRFADNRGRDQPGIHHLNSVVVSQVLVCRDKVDGRLSGLLERIAELLHELVVDGQWVEVHLLPAQILEGGDRAELWSADDNLGYV